MIDSISADHRLLWAKWDPEMPNRWHPVACHLIDVANVAAVLWKDALGEGMRVWMANELGLPVDVAGDWIALWIGLHDIGKISPAFQRQVREAISPLANRGFEFPFNDKQRVPHGSISTWMLPEILGERFGLPLKLSKAIAESVGGHHGLFTSPQSFAQDELQVGRKRWISARIEIVDWLATALRVPTVDLWPTTARPSTPWLLAIAGMTTVSDWVGSMAEFFPPAGPDVDFAAYVIKSRKMSEQLVNQLGWSGWVPPLHGRSLIELFPRLKETGPRPLQLAAAELTPELTAPSLVMIEAPMGEGKTEAAMLLADHWAAKCMQRGCYFALPTMATSNQMFDRVREFLEQTVDDGQRANLLLLHGRASLSEALRRLLAQSEHWDAAAIELDHVNRSELPNVVASEWFTYRKRGLLAPFGVGTIDQILLAVLQTKHVFVRLFGLAHKTIIIDEVHAYDAYMQQLLERLLEWLRAIGASVVLLSATLPAERRIALLKAYAGKSAKVGLSAEYPRISWVEIGTENTIRSRHFAATSLRNIQLKAFSTDVAAWARSLVNALQDGGCAAVICNTVRRAQEVYIALQEFFPKEELDLFHARYPFGEREVRERRTITTFGRSHNEQQAIQLPAIRPRRVLVATQVIEQSLDIDFDLMVTELAPVDLVLQRAGRLHRHHRQRPSGLGQPILWILMPENSTQVCSHQGDPVLNPSMSCPDWGVSGYVYEPHVLLRSWLALRNQTQITLPTDIEPLIAQVYDRIECPHQLPEIVQKEWKTSRKKLDDDRVKSNREADMRQIKVPGLLGSLSKVVGTDSLDEDDPEVHPALQALTRMGPQSVSIVCFAGTKDLPRWINPSGNDKTCVQLQDASICPSRDELELIIRSSVGISHPGVVRALLADGFQPPGWRKSSLLRQQRVVFLNEEGRSPIGNYLIELHPDLGLRFQRCDDLEDL